MLSEGMTCSAAVLTWNGLPSPMRNRFRSDKSSPWSEQLADDTPSFHRYHVGRIGQNQRRRPYKTPTIFTWYCLVKYIFVWASGVGSSRTIYVTKWRVSNHPVCLFERCGYQWCTFVHVPYTANIPRVCLEECMARGRIPRVCLEECMARGRIPRAWLEECVASGRIIEMSYDSVSTRLVISPGEVRWNKNSLILIYLVKKSEDGS